MSALRRIGQLMDWTRGSDDWEAENHRLRIEEDQEEIKKNTEHCRACGEWHSPDEDCEPVDERNS